MKRLFFALWPANETRNQLDYLNQSIKSADLKKVKRNNLHVTLVFLGHVDDKAEAEIKQKADRISIQPFTLCFDQLTFWKKPKILCLTTQQYDSQLIKLVNALNTMVEQCGIKGDKQSYHPHVTLARKASKSIVLDIEPIHWQAQSFCLLESCSTPDGVVYQLVQQWKLS